MKLFVVGHKRYFVPYEEVDRFEDYLADTFRTEVDAWIPYSQLGQQSESYQAILEDWAFLHWGDYRI